mmetsp:Transcript_14366/g.41924  ORF Transcript_14366/g.41924 Transcript_14366/m.41924 type:complete len:688 (+) Transcript_14366:84-2147(+)
MGNTGWCSVAGVRCPDPCRPAPLCEGSGLAADPRQLCDPAGAAFAETLRELDDMDRQLLLFAASSNVVAVRWLLALGARPLASDSNSTTCLHAACRSGAPAVVEELLASAAANPYDPSTSTSDIAGWTPLHVAAFMGRPRIASLLLKARAVPERRTSAGQTAADLCSDFRTHDIICHSIKVAALGKSNAHGRQFGIGEEDAVPDDRLNAASERVALHSDWSQVMLEPFFVLRNPIVPLKDRPPDLVRKMTAVAQAIFNHQPGRGLSFLVASGCMRDHPMNLVAFLGSKGLDASQVGAFLGEDFSLSRVLRMEFANSTGLLHTGVVTSLSKIFARFPPPHNLQKVDRILYSLAEVWWRLHQRAVGNVLPRGLQASEDGPCELRGFQLRRHLQNAGVLHQLLFSSVMLHWHLHAPLPTSERHSLAAWAELNRGLGSGGDDLPAEVLAPIYKTLAGSPIPELQFTSAPSEQHQQELPCKPSLATHVEVEGWVRLLGDNLPAPLDVSNVTGAPPTDCMKLSSMLTEATASSRQCPHDVPAAPRRSRAPFSPGPSEAEGLSYERGLAACAAPCHPASAPDTVWLSLCCSMLFLSSEPGAGAPFAFVPIQGMRFADIDPSRATFAIETGKLEADIDSQHGPLQLVFLLADGRWQSYELPRLAVRLCDPGRLQEWLVHLSELRGSRADAEPGPV